MITLFVVDKSLLRSYGIFLAPNKLISTVGEKIQFNSYKVGDSREAMQGFMMKYESQKSQNIPGTTPMPFTSDHSYTANNTYTPSINAFLNQCTYIQAQASIVIQ